MEEIKLTAKNVHETFMKCLYQRDEKPSAFIEVEAVMSKFGFHPQRLKDSEPLITEMLNDLPETFKKEGGGGMSFLKMCEDRQGNQWADLHITVDELVALGIATNKLSFLLPREHWMILPGEMPYLVVN